MPSNVLKSSPLLGAFVVGFLGAEAASAAKVPVSYYAVTMAVFTGIATIVKVYQWIDKTFDQKIGTAFSLHNEVDVARYEVLKQHLIGLDEKLNLLPCVAAYMCKAPPQE